MSFVEFIEAICRVSEKSDFDNESFDDEVILLDRNYLI